VDRLDLDRRRLERLRRGVRTTPASAPTIGGCLSAWFRREVAEPRRRLEGIAEIWTDLLPGPLLARTALLGFSGQVLTVAVDSASTGYELDRRLRAGLLRSLQRADTRGTIRRVRVRVDPARFRGFG